jgi:hypothetical protein
MPPLPKIITLPDSETAYLSLLIGDAVKVEQEGDVRTEYLVMVSQLQRDSVPDPLAQVETNLQEFGEAHQHFQVKRRYTQFRKLFEQILRETGPKGLPKFPSKTLLSKFRASVIQERKTQFQAVRRL